VDKFNQTLYEPPLPAAGRDSAPGWSDEDTLASFLQAMPSMTGARFGAAAVSSPG